MIACTHPGKMGDAIYALPAVKLLAERHGCQADFWTSDYCAPLKALFEAQPYIRSFQVAPGYRVERMDCGCQPWDMAQHVAPHPVPLPSEGRGDGRYKTGAPSERYEAVYNLGFRGSPDMSIPDYIAREAGVRWPVEIGYELGGAAPSMERLQAIMRRADGGKYIVLAPRGVSTFEPLFRKIMELCPVVVAQVGTASDYLRPEIARGHLFNLTGMDFLSTARVIAVSAGFVGLMSSQLCLANGFPIPRVAPHDGKSWCMGHVVQSPLNFYPVITYGNEEAHAREIMGMLGV